LGPTVGVGPGSAGFCEVAEINPVLNSRLGPRRVESSRLRSFASGTTVTGPGCPRNGHLVITVQSDKVTGRASPQEADIPSRLVDGLVTPLPFGRAPRVPPRPRERGGLGEYGPRQADRREEEAG